MAVCVGDMWDGGGNPKKPTATIQVVVARGAVRAVWILSAMQAAPPGTASRVGSRLTEVPRAPLALAKNNKGRYYASSHMELLTHARPRTLYTP